jgi:hypothetical protein
VVDRATATLGQENSCTFCAIMLAVPAAAACADAGDLDEDRRHLAVAERSAALWSGTAWQAAITETRAHLDQAEGDLDAARPTARRRPLPDGLMCDSAQAGRR